MAHAHEITDIISAKPIEEAALLLDDFYKIKTNVLIHISELSDSALFILCEHINIPVKFEGDYATVDNIKMSNRKQLIWYLVAIKL